MPYCRHIGCCLAAALTLVALVPAAVAASDTLYVDCNATGANNGTSWQDAYVDLQDALDFARASGGAIREINVMAGTYKPNRGVLGPWTSFELPAGVSVVGGWSLWEGIPVRHHLGLQSILSGQIDPAEGGHDAPVVKIGPDADSQTTLDGFTITGGGPFTKGGGILIQGSSPVIRDCVVTGNAGFLGGGLACENSQATIIDCTFSDNEAGEGGGADISGPVTFSNCRFYGNTATETGGGGVYCRGGTFSNCWFDRNTAETGGGGVYCRGGTFSNCWFNRNTASGEGGGMLCQYEVTASDCTFQGNKAGAAGGGISVNGTDAKFVRCGITGNTCSAGAGVCSFGGTFIDCFISANKASSTINGVGGGAVSDNTLWASCLFASNLAGAMGGGLYCIGPTRLNGCTVSANTAAVAGGLFNAGTQIVMDSSIVWDNSGGAFAPAVPSPQATYSAIEGGCPGEGNIGTDPWPNGDIIPSPCHNAGNPGYVPLPEETDIAGRPRIIAGRIDMGAHERPVGTLMGDIDADGCCDVVDLLYLYGSFGTVAGDAYYDFFCDLNSDGMIDVVDLLTLLENFGTCLE